MKILVIFGTRPEAIKMAPLVKALGAQPGLQVRVCVTGQHREMLDPVLRLFAIKPDYDLNIMQPGQSPSSVTSAVISGLEPILQIWRPAMVLVHGDTATTFAASLAAYHQHIDVGHVEAGLRTGNLYSPWPEEGNRRLTGILAKLHFAPTEEARDNLLSEGICADKIHVTGNTVIDALQEVKRKLEGDELLQHSLRSFFGYLRKNGRLVLITGHRRENFGKGLENICMAVRTLAGEFPGTDFLYPIHPNPKVLQPVKVMLQNLDNVHLVSPQEYLPFVYLLMRSHVILTDSGGIQEEALALGKPVLVTRDCTERPEAVKAGGAKLVGCGKDRVLRNLRRLLRDESECLAMAGAYNPYGDGNACARITSVLNDYKLRFAAAPETSDDTMFLQGVGITRPEILSPVATPGSSTRLGKARAALYEKEAALEYIP